MSVSFRWCWLLAGGLTVAAGALLAGPSWAEELGLDFWNVGRYSDILQREEARQAALQSYGLAVNARADAKSAVIEELRAGGLDLLLAAQRCSAIDREFPGFDARRFAWIFPGCDEQERYCHQLLYCVRIAGFEEPSDATTAALARLERQFEEHFGRPPKQAAYPRALYDAEALDAHSADADLAAEAAAREAALAAKVAAR